MSIKEVFGFEQRTKKKLPLFLAKISAGFPSPADDYIDKKLDLNEFLIKHPAATFFVKVEGDSMVEAGIHPGDLILVQKNIEPKNGDIVVAQVDEEWTLKYFQKRGRKVYLKAANEKYPTILPQQELVVSGVVVADVRKYR